MLPLVPPSLTTAVSLDVSCTIAGQSVEAGLRRDVDSLENAISNAALTGDFVAIASLSARRDELQLRLNSQAICGFYAGLPVMG